MIGKQVLHYRIVEKIGEGGMGVVYRAEDTRLHRDVALKFLPDEALEREEDRARFIAEARAAAALDHPAICTVHDINETDGHYFIAMAYVDGRDVKYAVDSDGPLPVLDAVRIGVQVAEGLSAAHEKGIVHRDIKSANVMLTSRGRAKIMDFGLAERALDERAGGEATTGGTVAYASPEQVAGESVDHRGDIWSFGVMLYEMVTGRLPFGGDYESAIIYSILNETPPPPSSLCEDFPADLERIITRALSKKPEERYQTIDEMRDELVQLRNAIDPAISRTAGTGVPGASGGNPWRRAAAAAGVTLGVAWLFSQIAGLVVGRLQLSPHIVTMVTVGVLALLPAVVVVAWFSAKRREGGWGRPEWIGVPANVVLACALLYLVFSGRDLGAAMQTVEVTNEEGETIERVIPKGAFRKSLALYLFENESGDPELDWLQYAVPALLEFDLYQDAFISVRSAYDHSGWERLQQAGFQSWIGAPLTLKRKIAHELHEKQFVTATINKGAGGGYVVGVEVYDTASGRLIEGSTVRGDDVFAIADEIAVDLKHVVEVPAWHLDGAPDLPVSEVVTASEDALREHTLAMKAMVFDEDWEAAREHLEAATAADSTMAFAHFHRFLAYRVTNDYEKAFGALQDALRHAYKVPERFRFIIKGNYYFLKQEPDKALALFEMMADLYPDDVQSFQALAQIHSMRNEIDESIAAMERIIELDPLQQDLLHQLATMCTRKGYYDKARQYVERYAELNPDDPKSFEELAELDQHMGDFRSAQANMDKALLLDPERVTLLVGAGNVDHALGDFQSALDRYGDALRLCRSSTDSMRVLDALEKHYEIRGQYGKSIEYMTRRLAMDPVPLNRYSEQLHDMDRYVHAGRADEAFDIIEKIESIFDTPPMSYQVGIGYARIYAAQEDPEGIDTALEDFERYIEAFGFKVMRPVADLARAQALELRGGYEAAVAIYERVIAGNPGRSTAHRALGRALRELGRYEPARRELERSLALYPSMPHTHDQLALLYRATGDPGRARRHLDRALAIWENADLSYRAAARARELVAEWDAAASM